MEHLSLQENDPEDVLMNWLQTSEESTWAKYQMLEGVARSHTDKGWQFLVSLPLNDETIAVCDKDTCLLEYFLNNS